MRDNELEKVMEPSAGMGGTGWERTITNPNSQDVSMLRPTYDATTGQWQFTFPNGSNLQAGQGGNSAIGPYRGSYRNDPGMMPPPSLQSNDVFFGPGGGAETQASNGGAPGGIPLRRLAKALPIAATLATKPGGSGDPNGNNSMSPELQQLLAQALKRMSQQDGLFAAINKQAMAGLPTIYQQ
jgi:hypothetical protein